MYEEIDRLPDMFYLPEELDDMARNILHGCDLIKPQHIAMYHIYKDGRDTGIVVLLGVESILDGLEAINRLWAPHGLYAEIGEFTEHADASNGYKLKSMEIMLLKFRYTPKIKEFGWDKMYIYKGWFKELI